MKKSLLPILLANLLLPSVVLVGGHLSKLEQFTLIVIVSTGELGFDTWLQAYEGNVEMRKKMEVTSLLEKLMTKQPWLPAMCLIKKSG